MQLTCRPEQMPPVADVVGCTCRAVVTWCVKVTVLTAGCRHAAVVGTSIVVVTWHGRAGACASSTGFVLRAEVVVGTGDGQVRGHTARCRIAAVTGAELLVITDLVQAKTAAVRLAGLVGRTRIAVITTARLDNVFAAQRHVTAVGCAGIVVPAVHRRTAADAGITSICLGTSAVVITRGLYRQLGAAHCRVAVLCCTHAAVVTGHGCASAAAAGTLVRASAGIAVIASCGVVRVLAACARLAGVVRTQVAVVAVYGDALARPCGVTGIVFGANLAVRTAGPAGRHVLAAYGWVAAVDGTGVAVVAIDFLTQTLAVVAGIVLGTFGIVVTADGCPGVLAAGYRVTQVLGAQFPVITQIWAAGAAACTALVVYCAQIPVVTRR